mgnify:CR=1 FL=1
MADKRALILDTRDNVATLLEAAEPGDCIMAEKLEQPLAAGDSIPYGHKIALAPIADGDDINKYGQRIGRATADIPAGSRVHVHNMQSAVDITFKHRLDNRGAS